MNSMFEGEVSLSREQSSKIVNCVEMSGSAVMQLFRKIELFAQSAGKGKEGFSEKGLCLNCVSYLHKRSDAGDQSEDLSLVTTSALNVALKIVAEANQKESLKLDAEDFHLPNGEFNKKKAREKVESLGLSLECEEIVLQIARVADACKKADEGLRKRGSFEDSNQKRKNAFDAPSDEVIKNLFHSAVDGISYSGKLIDDIRTELAWPPERVSAIEASNQRINERVEQVFKGVSLGDIWSAVKQLKKKNIKFVPIDMALQVHREGDNFEIESIEKGYELSSEIVIQEIKKQDKRKGVFLDNAVFDFYVNAIFTQGPTTDFLLEASSLDADFSKAARKRGEPYRLYQNASFQKALAEGLMEVQKMIEINPFQACCLTADVLTSMQRSQFDRGIMKVLQTEISEFLHKNPEFIGFQKTRRFMPSQAQGASPSSAQSTKMSPTV